MLEIGGIPTGTDRNFNFWTNSCAFDVSKATRVAGTLKGVESIMGKVENECIEKEELGNRKCQEKE